MLLGQKIETLKPDRHRIVRLETALNCHQRSKR